MRNPHLSSFTDEELLAELAYRKTVNATTEEQKWLHDNNLEIGDIVVVYKFDALYKGILLDFKNSVVTIGALEEGHIAYYPIETINLGGNLPEDLIKLVKHLSVNRTFMSIPALVEYTDVKVDFTYKYSAKTIKIRPFNPEYTNIVKYSYIDNMPKDLLPRYIYTVYDASTLVFTTAIDPLCDKEDKYYCIEDYENH